MNPVILYGLPVSQEIKSNLSLEIKKLSKQGIIPKIAAILIGENPASKIYVNSKHRTFKKMKCKSEIHHLSNDIDENKLINLIKTLNNDNNTHGILIQLPLPKHLNENKILNKVSPEKDVDGFHPENLGLLLQGNPLFIPCTPLGCIEILKFYNIDVQSKHVVIIGRSNIVGKPLMSLLVQKFDVGNATVTLCHTKTKNISKYTKQADIIFVATGQQNTLTDNMIKKGVVVINVGINRIKDNSEKGYHIVGDVDYRGVLEKVSAITPVPGGVGPMTITMLLSNTILSAKLNNKII